MNFFDWAMVIALCSFSAWCLVSLYRSIKAWRKVLAELKEKEDKEKR